MGWEGFGDVFKKVSEQFQSRIERLKNEKVKLEKELTLLNKKDSTSETAKRKAKVLVRLNEIIAILANNAKD